jgi:protein-ribulosamine 3-kinase
MQISSSIQTSIRQRLSQLFSPVQHLDFNGIGGGSINETYRVDIGTKTVFCKLNSGSAFPQLFEKEKAGLEIIAKQGIIKTPAVLDCFEEGGTQVLLLEWIAAGERTAAFWKNFGEQLAALHCCSSVLFGLSEDNYMGSVPQRNHQHKTWAAFFAEERLQPTMQCCFDKGLLTKKHLDQFELLQNRLREIFNEEKPSLLHGDLWTGNFMCNEASEPVLIDPAVYYGHRSVDLAMTTLFGGFRPAFYEAYEYHFPLPENYEDQWALCNLYPLLIHLYLFGSSYLSQIERTLDRFS